jgi:hypothetical protein
LGTREGLFAEGHRAGEAMSEVMTPTYRIREVDGRDDEIVDILTELHRMTFLGGASVPPFDRGHWWLAYCEATPVAFAGVVPSTHVRNAGYFCRVGVLQRHWGHRLQLRLMRARNASTAQRLDLHGFRYDRQRRLRQQLHPGRLSIVLAALSLGVSGYALLAQKPHFRSFLS